MSLLNFNPDPGLVSMDISTATHQIKFSYSKTKYFRAGESIKSPTFTVAGYCCEIHLYPQGTEDDDPSFMSLYLVLRCNSTVQASFGFSVLDKHGRSSTSNRLIFTFSPEREEYGFGDIVDSRSDLEAEFVKDDHFTIVCSVTILSNSHKEVPKSLVNGIVPSNITDNFSELLETKEMTDITFEVDGEFFNAHKLVLSARSPVFRALLFGEMAESKMKKIHIKDIKPVIFKAMLHFIYTDSVSKMSHEDTPLVTLVENLLEAADMYDLKGLKLICEERLVREISLDTVVSSLSLAEEHDCDDLKDACLDFISEPKILVQLAIKAEYVQLMQRHPSLLESINESATNNDGFCNLVSKEQRIN